MQNGTTLKAENKKNPRAVVSIHLPTAFETSEMVEFQKWVDSQARMQRRKPSAICADCLAEGFRRLRKRIYTNGRN